MRESGHQLKSLGDSLRERRGNGLNECAEAGTAQKGEEYRREGGGREAVTEQGKKRTAD